MITQLSAHNALLFIGIPALAVAVAALLVYAPSIASGPRYRPGLSWWAPPVWINGPALQPTVPGAPELTAGPDARTEPAADPTTPAATTTAPGTTAPEATAGTAAGSMTTATAGTGVARTTGGASASW